jgi:hypothetical protein
MADVEWGSCAIIGKQHDSQVTTEGDEFSDVPGNSVSEIGERMNGGAVNDERSPETLAILVS